MMTIRETNLFPSTSYLKQMKSSSDFQIEKHENYQKKSNRNRYEILAANGPMRLTVPLQKGKNKQTPIIDVKISYDQNWQVQHIKSIQGAYSNSPYFEYYMDELTSLLSKQHTYLWDLNHECLQWLLTKMKLNLSLDYTDTYVGVTSLDEPPCKTYEQVFSDKFGHQQNLSGLDLLMNAGPESKLSLI